MEERLCLLLRYEQGGLVSHRLLVLSVDSGLTLKKLLLLVGVIRAPPDGSGGP